MGRTPRLPRLMVIGDRFTETANRSRVRRLAENDNLRWIQLRDHAAEPADFEAACRSLVRVIRSTSSDVRITINSNVRLATELSVDLHVGFRGPDPAVARAQIGGDAVLGYSLHRASELTSAVEESVDYLLFGPVFDPISKPGRQGVGLDALRQVSTATEIPVYAVGGITPGRAESCFDFGAYGVATIGGVMQSNDPATALIRYHDATRDRRPETRHRRPEP